MSLQPKRNATHEDSGEHHAPRVDAHHHLWRYRVDEFGWIDDTLAALRRDFLVKDLEEELATAKIDGTVAVQARESLEETRWLLECARSSSAIWGVVGWAPLGAEDLPAVLDEFCEERRLAGFREVVQAQPDGYLDSPAFNRGIEELRRRGFTYDVLIHERQLLEATRFVDRHPQQAFVVDHAAKPKIASREIEPWAANLRELAKRPGVHCKLSGLVTEAEWRGWTPESLRPYLDVCVEAFGTKRLLAGSDWPVCLVASAYAAWWDVLRQYFAKFSESEKRDIFGENAVAFYGLSRPVL